MTFADATDHCQKMKAKIASRTFCVKDFLQTTGSNPVAWLSWKLGSLQYASDELPYSVTSLPAIKHKVVCEIVPGK